MLLKFSTKEKHVPTPCSTLQAYAMGGAGVRDGPIGRWSGALQRRKRIAKLFNYFQSWKIQRLQEMAKPAGERMLPAFNPPKPDLATSLLQSREL